MTSIHTKPHAIRLLHAIGGATLGSVSRPREVANFLKSCLQHPIKFVAEKAVESTPIVSFSEYFNVQSPSSINLSPQDLDRLAWNVRLDEEILIGLAIKQLNARQIFEIGTFNGQSTRRLAESAGLEARVFTLDIPAVEVDALNCSYFKGHQIGEKFHNSPVSGQITQLAGNSLTFDFSPYFGRMDFVFVDAAHDYKHGLADTRTALRLVRPGGVVFWHDFVPQWGGLVHGIKEGTQDYPLVRIGGTSFAAMRAPASPSSINPDESPKRQEPFRLVKSSTTDNPVAVK